MKKNAKTLLTILVLVAFGRNLLLAQDNLDKQKKPSFLNIGSLQITKVIPPPPADSTNDEDIREDAVATSNRKKLDAENPGNTVFCYADVLGSDFNPHRFPATAALFKEIQDDTELAVHAAKHTFQRPKPSKPGLSYPSGHSTKAYVIATLLGNLFPKEKEQLLDEAKEKAWNRVRLGNHYPTDDYAGEAYGKYLAQQFLNNKAFQKNWKKVQQEITRNSA